MLDFLKVNFLDLIAIAIASIALAKSIVKLTPSTKDDELVDKAESFLQKTIGFLGFKK